MGVRNGGQGLRASLESVLQQQGVDLELIVVDDGSDDDTPATLASFVGKDRRVRVVRQEKAGLTRALISGCAQARAPILARHDADDTSLPGRLARQVARLSSESELAFVSCWSRAVGPAGESLWESRPPSDPGPATRALLDGRQGPPGHGSVVMRRSAYDAVGGYRSAFSLAQDADLWLRLVDQGAFALVPEILYEYNVSGGGISGSRARLQLEYGLLAHACRAARQRGESEAALLRQAEAMRGRLAEAGPESAWRRPYFIGRCLAERRDPRARGYLWTAVRSNPLAMRAWLGWLSATLIRSPSAGPSATAGRAQPR